MKLYIYYETINTHNSDGTEHYLAPRAYVRLFPRAPLNRPPSKARPNVVLSRVCVATFFVPSRTPTYSSGLSF